MGPQLAHFATFWVAFWAAIGQGRCLAWLRSMMLWCFRLRVGPILRSKSVFVYSCVFSIAWSSFRTLFGHLLGLFWDLFGTQIGRARLAQEGHPELQGPHTFVDSSWTAPRTILGIVLGPDRSKKGPRWAQEGIL